MNIKETPLTQICFRTITSHTLLLKQYVILILFELYVDNVRQYRHKLRDLENNLSYGNSEPTIVALR